MSNYRVENLHPFYTYNIHIAAVTVATGSRSNAIFIQTLEDGEYEQNGYQCDISQYIPNLGSTRICRPEWNYPDLQKQKLEKIFS